MYFQRRAGDHLDKDGSMFMRLETDGPASFGGPFILAVNVAKYVFYVESHKTGIGKLLTFIPVPGIITWFSS